MIKKILIKLIVLPVAYIFFLYKYGNIWELKKYLQKQENPNYILLKIYENHFMKYGSWISYKSEFSGVPCFPHGPVGVFISAGSKIGKNVIIFQHVTIGSNTLNNSQGTGSPIINDNVYIGAGAKIIGCCHIGNNCRIGANAIIYRDIPSNSVAVQSPTRIIQKEKLDNRYYSVKNGKSVFFEDGRWIEDKNKKF